MGAKPDEDGFILVTRKGRDRMDGEESANRKKKRKRGTLEATDFYRFQRQERKLNRAYYSFWQGCADCFRTMTFISNNGRMLCLSWADLQELQAKFEEDKERIQRMKQARMFKPY